MAHDTVVSADVVTRKVQHMHILDGDRMAVETKFDAEPVMLEAEFIRTRLWSGRFGGTKELGLLKAATIPMPLWWELRRTGVLKDPVALQRWLDEHPKFKTTEGRALSSTKGK